MKKTIISVFIPLYLLSLPQNPQIVMGNASWDHSDPSSLEIQVDDRTFIDWSEFSIESDEWVRFHQPNSKSLVINRVTELYPTRILGRLDSIGQIVLINPNGILFGAEAKIDVGSFFASTLPLDLDGFKQNSTFEFFGGNAILRNEGNIKGREVVLLGRQVQHAGIVEAETLALFAAAEHLFYIPGERESLRLDQMSSLNADRSCKIDGFVNCPGGDVVVLGKEILLQDQAKIEASSPQGGGRVFVGGKDLSKNSHLISSDWTWVSEKSSIHADALVSGNGGAVVLWANEGLVCLGELSARGGTELGNGGFIEVSSAKGLDFNWRVNCAAPQGFAGQILLDPTNVVINNSATTAGVTFGNPTSWPALTNPVNIRFSDLNTALGVGNVTITTNVVPDPGAAGTIVVSSAIPAPFITWSSGNVLQLIAASNITIDSQILDTTVAATNANRVVIQSGGNISIGSTALGIVGSQNGGTLVTATGDITMSGSNRSAQIGFRTPAGQTASGPITVNCRNLNMFCGMTSGVSSQIGHGDFTTVASRQVATILNGAVNPNINVRAFGNITMTSGPVTANGTQIGHGAFRLATGAGSNQTGNISVVCDGNLFMNNQAGGGSNLMAIGHGSQLIDAGGIPSVSGSIEAIFGGNVTMRSGDIGASQSIIGHHGLFTGATIFSIIGDIDLCCRGNLSINSGTFGSSSAILGNLSIGTDPGKVISGNYVFNVGGDLSVNNLLAPPNVNTRCYIGGLETTGATSSIFLCNLNLSVCGNTTISCPNNSGGTTGIGFGSAFAGSATEVMVAIGGNLNATNVAASRSGLGSEGNLTIAVGGDVTLSAAGPGTSLMRIGGSPTAATRFYVGGNLHADGSPTGNKVQIGVYIPTGGPSNLVDVRAGGDIQWTTDYNSTVPGGITLLAGHPFSVGQLWTSDGSQLLTVCGQNPVIAFPVNCAPCGSFISSSASISRGCGAFTIPLFPAGPSIADLNTTGDLQIGSSCSSCSPALAQSISIGNTPGTDRINIPVNPASFSLVALENVTVRIPITTTSGPIEIQSCNQLDINPGANLTTPGQAITLISDADNNGQGNLNLQANLTSAGGPIFLGAGPTAQAGTSSINQTGNSTVSSGVGNIQYQAVGNILVNGSANGITSTSGTIDLEAGLNITINKQIQSTGGYIHTLAGDDTTLEPLAPSISPLILTSGDIQMVTGNDMFLNAGAVISSLGNQVVLVVDNDFPAAPLIGTGFLFMDSSASVNSGPGSLLQIYTARQPLNTILGLLNGVSFFPGTLFADSLQEIWCTYFPDGLIGSPFTIYYKDCLQQITNQATVVVDQFLVSLHPYNEFPGWREEFWMLYSEKFEFVDYKKTPYYLRRRHLNSINHPKTYTILTN